MIIDLILNRKDGIKYSPKAFYNYLMGYYKAFPGLVEPIADALDSGTNKDVQNALCDYINKEDYNADLCNYIKSVQWV